MPVMTSLFAMTVSPAMKPLSAMISMTAMKPLSFMTSLSGISLSKIMILSSIAFTSSVLAAENISVGPRPLYMADQLPEGELKEALLACDISDMKPNDFSIGHRGAPLQFPEHTLESYIAAARMGAGIVECDVTFTKDRELVCRHSQCDLHTTTNILATPLAEKCSVSPDYNAKRPFEDVQCCTSDITLEEFKSLKGKMDASNRDAETLDEYMNSTANWRTDLYAHEGTLLSHAESIQLFDKLGVGMTPELKEALVPLPFDGDYTRHQQATQMLQEYRDANIDPSRVWPQSFEAEDIAHWIRTAPEFAGQAVYLDGRYRQPGFNHLNPDTWEPTMAELKEDGVQYLAPPLWMLVTLDENQRMIPSPYAAAANEAELNLIAWSLERSGPIHLEDGGWYHQSVRESMENEGSVLTLLDVLAKEVGVVGVFSDWPATTSYYAHCRL